MRTRREIRDGRGTLVLAACFCGLVLFTVPVFAQGHLSDAVVGTVEVPAAVAATSEGADRPKVLIFSEESDEYWTVETSRSGNFTIAHLLPGTYDIQANFLGLFSERQSVSLAPGEIARLALKIRADSPSAGSLPRGTPRTAGEMFGTVAEAIERMDRERFGSSSEIAVTAYLQNLAELGTLDSGGEVDLTLESGETAPRVD